MGKVKTFKKTIGVYLSTLLPILSLYMGFEMFRSFITDDSVVFGGAVFLTIFWLLFTILFVIIWYILTFEKYNTRITKFKIVSYDKWDHDKEKYDKFFMVFKVIETDISIYQWHLKTKIDDPEINQELISDKHYGEYLGSDYFTSKEKAMKYIFEIVKSKLKMDKTIQQETFQNIKELEEITFEEVVEQLNEKP